MTKAYSFRLASVLRLRRAELDQAELALMQANAHLRALIAYRQDALAHCASLDAARGHQDVESFAAQRAQVALAANAVLRLDGRINVAAAEAALAHIHWSTAHQRVATLERLDEKRRAEWQTENSRHEANELDELATAAFVRAHEDSGGRLR